jgi:hypothetical protein
MDIYLRYYELERYLFEVVNPRFHSDHELGAFDFFSIVVWKANRAKSTIARRLLAAAAQDDSLENIARRLTRALYSAPDDRQRMRTLVEDYRFRLPMASAILTVLWPDDFTVYDVRVCNELSCHQTLHASGSFKQLWEGYVKFREAVRELEPKELSLRDKDRMLWGRSVWRQLERDISNGFVTQAPADPS